VAETLEQHASSDRLIRLYRLRPDFEKYRDALIDSYKQVPMNFLIDQSFYAPALL